MADRARPYIGDDLHVPVRMHGKAAVRRDPVGVPHDQRADADARRVAVAAEAEMVPGIEPAMVGVPQRAERNDVDHDLRAAFGDGPERPRRSCGARKSISGPFGTMPVGLMVRWLS